MPITNPDQLRNMNKYCGIYYTSHSCFPEMCKRDNEHTSHVWREQTIKLYKQLVIKKDKDEEAWLPLGWYNFEVAKRIIEKAEPTISTSSLEERALKMCADQFFDFNKQEPKNICEQMGYMNYSKLLKSFSDDKYGDTQTDTKFIPKSF